MDFTVEVDKLFCTHVKYLTPPTTNFPSDSHKKVEKF